jgi:hypothetical protein
LTRAYRRAAKRRRDDRSGPPFHFNDYGDREHRERSESRGFRAASAQRSTSRSGTPAHPPYGHGHMIKDEDQGHPNPATTMLSVSTGNKADPVEEGLVGADPLEGGARSRNAEAGDKDEMDIDVNVIEQENEISTRPSRRWATGTKSKAPEGAEWWRDDNTPFKEFHRAYSSLKSVQSQNLGANSGGDSPDTQLNVLGWNL